MLASFQVHDTFIILALHLTSTLTCAVVFGVHFAFVVCCDVHLCHHGAQPVLGICRIKRPQPPIPTVFQVLTTTQPITSTIISTTTNQPPSTNHNTTSSDQQCLCSNLGQALAALFQLVTLDQWYNILLVHTTQNSCIGHNTRRYHERFLDGPATFEGHHSGLFSELGVDWCVRFQKRFHWCHGYALIVDGANELALILECDQWTSLKPSEKSC